MGKERSFAQGMLGLKPQKCTLVPYLNLPSWLPLWPGATVIFGVRAVEPLERI